MSKEYFYSVTAPKFEFSLKAFLYHVKWPYCSILMKNYLLVSRFIRNHQQKWNPCEFFTLDRLLRLTLASIFRGLIFWRQRFWYCAPRGLCGPRLTQALTLIFFDRGRPLYECVSNMRMFESRLNLALKRRFCLPKKAQNPINQPSIIPPKSM